MTAEVSVRSAAPAAELPVLQPAGQGWQRFAALFLSVALLIAVIWKLTEDGLEVFAASLPTAPAFYVALLASYLTLPLFDWLIFRRLWGLPLAGLPPLLKKRVANDVLVNFSGEAYFYLWARQRTNLTASPFGAVKDVSILSALAGNAMTLLLLAAAWPLADQVALSVPQDLLLQGSAVVVGVSLLMWVLRGRIFSLPAPRLREVFGLHFVRITISTLLLALAWYFALPQVGAEHWVLFAALRLLVSRLPLIPSKDLLFAAAALFLAGSGDEVGTVLAASGALFLAANLFFGLVLSAAAMLDRGLTR